MTLSKAKRRSQSGIGMYVIVALSLAVHGLIAFSADFSFGSKTSRTSEQDSLASAIEFRYSCSADAYLAWLARGVSCTLPGHPALCQTKAYEDYRLDLFVCDGLKETESIDSEEFAFLDSDEIDKLVPKALLDIDPIDELEAAKLFDEAIEEKVEAAEKAISKPMASGQVVEVLAPDVEMTPDNARFVSEYNTKVARETVARGTTEKMVAKPAAKELEATDTPEPLFEDPTPSGPEPSAVATSEAKPARDGPGAGGRVSASPLLAMRATEYRPEHKAGEVDGSDALADNGLASKLGDHGQASSGQDAQEGREAVAAGMGGGGSPLNLRPSQEMLERAMGGGSVDKIDGVESGDTTALNSKKWKFASFFNRMKRQVAQNWHPAGVFARRDPSGKVYGVKNRETVLELYLKPDGSLDRYVILQSSGVDFLDDEAGAAFERAQPFPNPPSGLLDQSSQRIRFSFGFHFRVGSRQESWRVFRQN